MKILKICLNNNTRLNCVKLKTTITEMNEILDAAYNESAISQARIYHWYSKFKSGRKSVDLIMGRKPPTSALTKQTINISATMIFDDAHLTVRQLALLLDISIGAHILVFQSNTRLSRMCA